ncbi:hypothetical protein DDD_0129 [Nonlabens dokdonensis DSW-6]|uniref:Uncharacterized protein n=1 Tax=Nonlabens dokdonensis (strain DSM 17205 / KCTC 12402 / DSW-6) TaxID=592029 RepID=L7W651_NONDD|nr:hypothetical protein DDD_0129 [Nonlabens dokdonensis DSW-6]
MVSYKRIVPHLKSVKRELLLQVVPFFYDFYFEKFRFRESEITT